ncbi:GGDEF domain-containing protein [Mycobacterium sp. MYCO198283]|uniref:GGDEF domain-containing protein n=1 Tax=Mycobacterium sp. MYCO198283 TaxID=2883505 RepID=UPI001E3B65EF|nr:GGDEF domain-containing protein [Mycobacterium sp. MYCO198283]MCG5434477.1 GGDEF domain-containing protein [Mycobacterium sp. MYCO198283]
MIRGLRGWWRQPDHYYWLTAFLAGRGAQRGTCRVVAATVFGFGLVALGSIGSPSGPTGDLRQGVAAAIVIGSVLMALAWLRGQWLSRSQSICFVLLSMAGIAAGCLVQTDPFNGLFGGTAFAVLAGYVAFFHTPRYLALNLLVAASTAGVLALRLVQEGGDVRLAVSTLLFLAVINAAVPFACQALVHLLGINVLNGDIDPLTGLLNREAFYRAAAGFIASRNRDDDRHLVIVVISLDNFTLLTHTDGEVSGNWAHVAVGQTLRETTRRGAVVAHVAEAEFVVADSFPSPDATPLVERVRSAIATTPPRTTASVGVASTPLRGLAQYPPQDVLDELLAIAEGAMRDARRAGGNQSRQVVRASLTALERDDPAG